MDGIKDYIFSLMIIAFSCAVVELVGPEDKGMSKHLHFLSALVISVLLLSPIQSLVGVFPDIFNIEYDLPAFAESESYEDYSHEIITESIDNIKSQLNNELKRKFDCAASEITVDYDASDTENVEIKKIWIGYNISNRYLYSDTENYIEELMKCDCEVYLSGE